MEERRLVRTSCGRPQVAAPSSAHNACVGSPCLATHDQRGQHAGNAQICLVIEKSAFCKHALSLQQVVVGMPVGILDERILTVHENVASA